MFLRLYLLCCIRSLSVLFITESYRLGYIDRHTSILAEYSVLICSCTYSHVIAHSYLLQACSCVFLGVGIDYMHVLRPSVRLSIIL